MRALIAGDTDRAEVLATEALQIASESGQPDAALIYGAQLMNVSGQRGTMSDLVPLIEQMVVDAPDISPWLFGSLLAKAHVEAGRFDEARQKLSDFAAAGFELPLDQIYLVGMVDYAEAAIECGDAEYAGPLFERLLPWAALLPATGASVLAPVCLYLGGLATVLGALRRGGALPGAVGRDVRADGRASSSGRAPACCSAACCVCGAGPTMRAAPAMCWSARTTTRPS